MERLEKYPHYMLKEIEEEVEVVDRVINKYSKDGQLIFDANLLKELNEAEHIVILGCGTSYHAGLIGGDYFKKRGFVVENHIASEYAYDLNPVQPKTVFILISQSGETTDLLVTLPKIEASESTVIALANVDGSSLMKSSKYQLSLLAGPEIAIASTKAFTAQVLVLAMLASATIKDFKILNEIKLVRTDLEDIISKKEKIHEIAKKIAFEQSAYYIGRGSDYYAALESSLKLKEVNYIHSEALYAGELKHGPMALLKPGYPVLGFISNARYADLMRGNLKECSDKDATVVIISLKSMSKSTDSFVIENSGTELAVVPFLMVTQYLSYYVGLTLGRDIDKPRNLVKAVMRE